MAKHVRRHSKGYPDRRIMHPQREWAIGLGIFACTVLFGSVLAGNLFVQYKNIDAVGGDAGDNIPRYKTVTVDDALELYEKRKEEYVRLRSVQPVVQIEEIETATTTPDVLGESATTTSDVVEEGLEGIDLVN